MAFLRMRLMEVRAHREDWDTGPEIDATPWGFQLGGVGKPSPLVAPPELPEPLPEKARGRSNPADYIPA